ncbi:MAG: response regulator [Spirochaetota bacterium]|nr:response regulator [Spirochaetota bacterium]
MKKTILVVEDNIETSEMLKHLFEGESYEVTLAANSYEVFSVLDKKLPDLILLDVLLEGMNGFDICKKIKLEQKTNLVPIIMLTALRDNDNYNRGIKVGADAYLTKPFEINKLLNTTNELLSKSKKLTSGLSEAIDFSLNSEPEQLNQLISMLSVSLSRTKLTQDEIDDVKSGLYEIAANAMEWGNEFNKSLKVYVNYKLFHDGIIIRVQDEGPGFNCQDFLSPDYHPINLQDTRLECGKRLGGFGIKLANSYFDHLAYDKSHNTVIMKKSLVSKG